MVLDTGALVAFERGDRATTALLRAAWGRKENPVTSSGCVAQVWRGGPGQALLARLLRGVQERPIEPTSSRMIGALCGRTGATDVVDAHVALLTSAADVVLTSDVDGIEMLLDALEVEAVVQHC